MELQDPKRIVGDWLERYERTAGADAAQLSALRAEIDKMNAGQLEKFAAWLEERNRRTGPADGASRAGLRGFGLQAAAAAQSKRRMSLPGLRFIRAGL